MHHDSVDSLDDTKNGQWFFDDRQVTNGNDEIIWLNCTACLCALI